MSKCTMTFSLEEKIGLKHFSNIVVGPITITRECEDTPENRAKLMAELVSETEGYLDAERSKIREWAKEQGLIEA